MFKQSQWLLALLLALPLFEACDPLSVRAKGELITMEFEETGFHGLELNVPADAEVRIGDGYKVEITCEETAMPLVETRVESGVLKVYFRGNVWGVDNMKVRVTAPSWDAFDLSGSGSIEVLDTIQGQSLELEVSGSGRILVQQANFDHADADVSGSGTIELRGLAEKLNGDVSGSGKIDAFDFVVDRADVEISGSGDVYVHALQILDADISGSGSVIYQGDPAVNAHISGSGSVRKQ
ncbi:MAG: head GIN domain-containing protein [Saprospiraceae bacterium]|nr:head GIN domain-containing protein [Saprospiraceae bacterium]